MYGPTMQYISKTYYQMFQLSVTVPNVLGLNRHWSIILINHRLLDACPTVIQT